MLKRLVEIPNKHSGCESNSFTNRFNDHFTLKGFSIQKRIHIFKGLRNYRSVCLSEGRHSWHYLLISNANHFRKRRPRHVENLLNLLRQASGLRQLMEWQPN